MELKAQYRFDAPVERVWDLLMDPNAIASCVPGCEEFEPLGEDRYRVVFKAVIAAVTGSFTGTVALVDKQPLSSYRLVVEGSGAPGFANGESLMTLTAGESGAVVDVAATLTVGGLVAQVGQRLLGATARLMMDRFFKCLQARLAPSNAEVS
jgi:carbon monoxide dehydrogenase subunit G